MKKLIAILFLFIIVAGLTNAQSKMQLGVGGFVGLPIVTFDDNVGIGFGGIVQGEYNLGANFVGTFTTGYLFFPGKEYTLLLGPKAMGGDWSIIPLMFGVKYYFTNHFFAEAQAGVNISSDKIPAVAGTGLFGATVNIPGRTVNSSGFGYNFGIGYNFGEIDLTAKLGSFAFEQYYAGFTALYKFSL